MPFHKLSYSNMLSIIFVSDKLHAATLLNHDEYSHMSVLIKMSSICFVTQSLTVSLQGFLNAIVYGWTRQDFVVELNLGNSTLEVSIN